MLLATNSCMPVGQQFGPSVCSKGKFAMEFTDASNIKICCASLPIFGRASGCLSRFNTNLLGVVLGVLDGDGLGVVMVSTVLVAVTAA